MAKTKRLPNMRRKRNGWQAYVRIGGRLVTEQFPIDTAPSEIQAWVERHRGTVAPAPTGDTFAADVAAYLRKPAIAHMPTIGQRTKHLDLWLQELGAERPTRTITTDEIDAVIARWSRTIQGPTIRKRCSALQSLFTVSCPTLVNPVKRSNRPAPRQYTDPRAIDYDTIDRILAAMPESRSRRFARVIAFTGFPPATVNALTADDVILQGAGSVRVPERKKGAGIESRRVPLTADGLAAFKAFHAANDYGQLPDCLAVTFQRAARRIGIPAGRVRLYDLRHSFLTHLYAVTRDLATVARLGLHAPGSPITARYALAANGAVDTAAIAAFQAALTTARRVAIKTAPGEAVRVELPASVARKTEAA